jgi:hypothetical protein
MRKPCPAYLGAHLSGDPLAGGFFASVPDHLGVDRGITGMSVVAWKQPYAGLSPQAAPGRWATPPLRMTGCLKNPESIAPHAASSSAFELAPERSLLHAYIGGFRSRDSGEPQAG